jgi:SAM-dependent methyltransferase
MTSPQIRPGVSESISAQDYGIRFACPVCSVPLDSPGGASEIACLNCRFVLRAENGIWQAIPQDRLARYQDFIREYEYVRQAEGRGSSTADYYLALPFRDLSGSNTAQWAIRARTFSYFQREILSAAEASIPSLKILDLGAGNGWFSYRMALRGHRPVAVDLLTNDFDALGAARVYQHHLRHPFPRVRAELERLPFPSEEFDLAVFNASFHYSEDFRSTLGEALRCVVPGGAVAICDSPWYSMESSGHEMVRERHKHFLSQFGFASDSIESQEFLTDQRLERLEAAFGIQWEIHRPSYGVRWALRPFIARWQRRREPSQFRIFVARRP